QLLEIVTSRERGAPCGKHHRAHRAIRGDRRKLGAERGQQGLGQGVARARPVEGENGDRTDGLTQERRLGGGGAKLGTGGRLGFHCAVPEIRSILLLRARLVQASLLRTRSGRNRRYLVALSLIRRIPDAVTHGQQSSRIEATSTARAQDERPNEQTPPQH